MVCICRKPQLLITIYLNILGPIRCIQPHRHSSQKPYGNSSHTSICVSSHMSTWAPSHCSIRAYGIQPHDHGLCWMRPPSCVPRISNSAGHGKEFNCFVLVNVNSIKYMKIQLKKLIKLEIFTKKMFIRSTICERWHFFLPLA